MPKIISAEKAKEAVTKRKDGLIRVDGVAIFGLIVREGVLYLQIYDRNRERAICRGSRYIEMEFDLFVKQVLSMEQLDGRTKKSP
jgi:hypothetical protein